MPIMATDTPEAATTSAIGKGFGWGSVVLGGCSEGEGDGLGDGLGVGALDGDGVGLVVGEGDGEGGGDQ